MIIPGNLIFFPSNIFPYNSLGADASQVSCLGMSAVTSDPGRCSNSMLTGSEADHPYFCKYILNKIVVLQNLCLCQSPLVKTGCTQLLIWSSYQNDKCCFGLEMF